MTRMTVRTITAVACAVALALGVVACSGGDDTAATTAAPQLPTTPSAPRAAVAVQDDRLVNLDTPVAERIPMIAATGASMARIDVFWKDVAPTRPADATDPADPAYRFDRLDAIVTGLKGHGIEPILAVFNAPEWASGTTTVTPAMPYNSVPPDPEAFGQFMQAVSARYSGTFRAGGETLPRVRVWELWNEPNQGIFLQPSGGTAAWLDTYAGMVKHGYAAVKRGGGKDTVVLVGATGPRGKTGPKAVGARDWLDGIVERDLPLDAYSQHIYPAAAPRDVTKAVPSWATLPELMRTLHAWRPGTDVYITEAGYTTATTPYRKVAVTEDEQARYLRDMFSLELTHDPHVKAIVWFNLQDNPNWPAGLLRVDGSEKPSYAVFTEIAAAK